MEAGVLLLGCEFPTFASFMPRTYPVMSASATWFVRAHFSHVGCVTLEMGIQRLHFYSEICNLAVFIVPLLFHISLECIGLSELLFQECNLGYRLLQGFLSDRITRPVRL